MSAAADFTLELSDLEFVFPGLDRPENVLAEADGTLWTPDNRGALTRIDPDGTLTTVGAIGPECNGFALEPDGLFTIANIGDGNVYRMDRDGNHTLLLDEVCGHPLGASNDVYVDRRGRRWISVSTLANPWFLAAAAPRPDGYIILWDEDGPRVVADGIFFTNELKMDADERYLYVAETMKARILRYPVSDDGSLGEAEVFGPDGLAPGGFVDGFAFDADGNLWVTLITRNALGIITPDGDYHTVFEDVNQEALDHAVAKVEANSLTPEEMYACMGATVQFPTSVTFAGPDLRTVYLGSLAMPHLVRFRSPVPGLPLPHWS